jgi:hypothetical protein
MKYFNVLHHYMSASLAQWTFLGAIFIYFTHGYYCKCFSYTQLGTKDELWDRSYHMGERVLLDLGLRKKFDWC